MRPHQHTNPTSNCIDLALGMQRLRTTDKSIVMEALRILGETLKEDLLILQEAEEKNDFEAALIILVTIRRGLGFSGAPRLEAACNRLDQKLKSARELRALFALVYEEAELFAAQYQELLRH